MGNETKGGFRQSVNRTWPTAAGFEDEKVIGPGNNGRPAEGDCDPWPERQPQFYNCTDLNSVKTLNGSGRILSQGLLESPTTGSLISACEMQCREISHVPMDFYLTVF